MQVGVFITHIYTAPMRERRVLTIIDPGIPFWKAPPPSAGKKEKKDSAGSIKSGQEARGCVCLFACFLSLWKREEGNGFLYIVGIESWSQALTYPVRILRKDFWVGIDKERSLEGLCNQALRLRYFLHLKRRLFCCLVSKIDPYSLDFWDRKKPGRNRLAQSPMDCLTVNGDGVELRDPWTGRERESLLPNWADLESRMKCPAGNSLSRWIW